MVDETFVDTSPTGPENVTESGELTPEATDKKSPFTLIVSATVAFLQSLKGFVQSLFNTFRSSIFSKNVFFAWLLQDGLFVYRALSQNLD